MSRTHASKCRMQFPTKTHNDSSITAVYRQNLAQLTSSLDMLERYVAYHTNAQSGLGWRLYWNVNIYGY